MFYGGECDRCSMKGSVTGVLWRSESCDRCSTEGSVAVVCVKV